MSAATDLLFAYGTLMRGLPLHHLIEGRAEFVAAGSISGRWWIWEAIRARSPAGRGRFAGRCTGSRRRAS